MRGSIFRYTTDRGATRWRVQVDLPATDGSRKRVSKGGFKLRRDAEAELERMLREAEEARRNPRDPRTLAQFLDEWFRQHAERNCAFKTTEQYKELAQYLLPHLGEVSLADLTPLAIERTLNALKDRGGRHRRTGEPRPLSGRTVRHIAALLSVALNAAVRWGLLPMNPMKRVQLPRAERPEKPMPDVQQMQWYLDTVRARAPWLHPILVFIAATGCRRGEALALTWDGIDLQRRLARIARSLEQTRNGLAIKSTKTRTTRLVPLPPSLVEVLTAHKRAQDELKDFYGAEYKDYGLVFCAPDGDYLKPNSVTAKASLLAREAGLKCVGIHTLRHLHGSQLLSAGVPLPTVSRRLGHSSVWTTANVYSHALPPDEIAAAEAWERQFGAPLLSGEQGTNKIKPS
jgi:integrase